MGGTYEELDAAKNRADPSHYLYCHLYILAAAKTLHGRDYRAAISGRDDLLIALQSPRRTRLAAVTAIVLLVGSMCLYFDPSAGLPGPVSEHSDLHYPHPPLPPPAHGDQWYLHPPGGPPLSSTYAAETHSPLLASSTRTRPADRLAPTTRFGCLCASGAGAWLRVRRVQRDFAPFWTGGKEQWEGEVRRPPPTHDHPQLRPRQVQRRLAFEDTPPNPALSSSGMHADSDRDMDAANIYSGLNAKIIRAGRPLPARHQRVLRGARVLLFAKFATDLVPVPSMARRRVASTTTDAAAGNEWC
ncbi:hypothetical protein B0H12DRAFT_1229253 [Mycena haematopus]|nr:hypothetical protein B0H12DRAFT_1229253 [Mycena haematopus]